MSPTMVMALKAMLLAIPLGTVTFAAFSDNAWGEEVLSTPPAAYIATTQPEYFDGRAVYWYNNFWYYHDTTRWSFYRDEPPSLRDRRSNWVGRPRYRYHR